MSDIRTATAPVWTRHLSRVALRVPSPATPAASGLAVLARRDGPYHRAAGLLTGGQPAGIAHWRVDIGHLGPWDKAANLITDKPAASLPSLALDPRRRLLCGFRVDGSGPDAAGGYEAASDDDGDTWSEAAMSIPNARYYRVRAAANGGLMRLAWIDDGAGHTPPTGHLQTSYQAPGDPAPSALVTLTDETGAVISAADAVPDLDHVSAGTSPWRLSVLEAGKSDPTEFASTHETDAAWLRMAT